MFLRIFGDNRTVSRQGIRQTIERLARLRKGDHNAEWLRIERGKLNLELKKYKDQVAARKEELNPAKSQDGGIPIEVFEQIEKELKLL